MKRPLLFGLALLCVAAAPPCAVGATPAPRVISGSADPGGLPETALPAATGHAGMRRALARSRAALLGTLWDEALAVPPPGALGGPLRGIPTERWIAFLDGRRAFHKAFDIAAGLGPFYNAASCASCHVTPTPGGSGGQTITVYTPPDDANDTRGLRAAAIPGHEQEHTDGAKATRRTPPLYGLGLLDTLPDATLAALADPDDRDGDGLRGRLSERSDRSHTYPARFGHKANDWNLRRFMAGALRDEMGITSPVPRGAHKDTDGVADPEQPSRYVDRLHAFVAWLAPPPRGPIDAEVKAGEAAFTSIGCAGCHRATLGDGEARVSGAYSDLLLHNVGPQLSDGLTDNLAGPSDWRTAPLWGLRFRPRLLHDESETTLAAVIARHGGEAAASAQAYAALPEAERQQLLRFLESL